MHGAMDYSIEELQRLGLRSVGSGVKIHRTVVLFNPQNISIGNNVRIDCFSLLSAGGGGIEIGNCVHIAAGCYLFGSGGKIVLEHFSGLSSRVSLYTASDDYLDGYLTNPTVPDEFKKVRSGDVILRKHAVVGAGSVNLPRVEIKQGASVGALACVRKDIDAFAVCVAAGAGRLQVIAERSKERLFELERRYLRSEEGRKAFPEGTGQ